MEFQPRHPYYPEPSPAAADVPMMISSTFNEITLSRTDASLENITLAQVKEKMKTRLGWNAGFGDNAAVVADVYAKAFPDKKPVEIWSMAISNRQSTIALAET